MFGSRVLRANNNTTRCLVLFENCLLHDGLTKGNPIFKQPIKDFKVYEWNNNQLPCKIGILGSKKTEFLNALAMKYIPSPPLSRKYPLMAETNNYDQIEYLNFQESSGLDKVHLSARYESYSYKGTLEMSDDVNSVKNYITGNNNYNKNSDPSNQTNPDTVDRIIEDFNLSHLTNKWINTLSNGQLRRARIAKSMLRNPKLLIIDDPFLGLDPIQTDLVSKSLEKISNSSNISIVLGLRFQDKIPDWITHIGKIGPEGIDHLGPKSDVIPYISQELDQKDIPQNRQLTLQEISNNDIESPDQIPFIEFKNASVIYKQLPVLTDFNWKIPKGSNWRILGENGTGKTTILSLITADHPQSWRSVLSFKGKLRKTGSGMTFFDVNNQIGMSSPELHSLTANNKTMNQIIKNGLVKDIGNSNFQFSGEKLEFPNDKIKQVMNSFTPQLQQYGDWEFTTLPITMQKLTLFLRAIAKDPELIILDEAFSCMDDIELMRQCHKILEDHFEDATILTIGHIEWELPLYDFVLHLLGNEDRLYKIYKVLS